MGAELVPVYLLGNEAAETFTPTRIIKAGILTNGGRVVNDELLYRWEALSQAAIGMGVTGSPDSLVDIGHLLGRHRRVVVFRGVRDTRTIRDEGVLPSLSVVRYSDPEDLTDLVAKELRNFREDPDRLIDRYSNERAFPLDHGGLHIDFETRQVKMGGEYLRPLSRRKTAIVELLNKYRGCVLTTKEILHEVWGSKYFVPQNVKMEVSMINHQIGKLPDGQFLIRNRNWIGYYVPLEEGGRVDPVTADDLIVKRGYRRSWPFGIEVKVPQITNGELTIDFMQMLCFVRGQPLDLIVRELKLLMMFALNKGVTVSNESLYGAFYGGDDEGLYRLLINKIVSGLNIKIRDAGAEKRYITTHRRIGREMPDYRNPESLVAGVS